MKTPSIEELIRLVVREEIARLLGVEPKEIDDEDDLRRRAAERGAKIRAARKVTP